VALLARNRRFAEEGRHQGIAMFPITMMVITCMDPRVDPAHYFGLDLGDALVVRNGGGRVTDETIETVAFLEQLVETLAPGGELFEVAIVHHTQCGAGFLADDDFRQRYAERIGVEETTLRELAVVDPVVTVAMDVDRLLSATAISARLRVSGHVYNVTSGLVQTIIPAGRKSAVSAGSA
jgi:carbonic anhydrase